MKMRHTQTTEMTENKELRCGSTSPGDTHYAVLLIFSRALVDLFRAFRFLFLVFGLLLFLAVVIIFGVCKKLLWRAVISSCGSHSFAFNGLFWRCRSVFSCAISSQLIIGRVLQRIGGYKIFQYSMTKFKGIIPRTSITKNYKAIWTTYLIDWKKEDRCILVA